MDETVVVVIGSPPGDPEAHTFGRGDYGTEYAGELIDLIEQWNCSKGCTHSGDQAERDEFGPGGNCHLLAALFIGEPIPEFERQADRLICRHREDPATVGMEPLFPAAGEPK